MQTNHQNSFFEQKRFPIILVCDSITKAPNLGSLFRIADAFGVEKLVFCGKNIPLGRRMTKTSRATEKVVAHEVREDILELISDLKSKGYSIISIEITSDSIPIHNHIFDSKPIALIIGDENKGISDSVLNLSDFILHIDMYGKNSSMNVVQAAAIALYQITRFLKKNK